MAFVEDFSAFLNADEFAVTGTLDGVPVTGILDNGYTQALDGISTAEGSFLLPSSATVAVNQASLLAVGTDIYRVRSVQPDGTGLSALLLERQ